MRMHILYASVLSNPSSQQLPCTGRPVVVLSPRVLCSAEEWSLDGKERLVVKVQAMTSPLQGLLACREVATMQTMAGCAASASSPLLLHSLLVRTDKDTVHSCLCLRYVGHHVHLPCFHCTWSCHAMPPRLFCTRAHLQSSQMCVGLAGTGCGLLHCHVPHDSHSHRSAMFACKHSSRVRNGVCLACY